MTVWRMPIMIGFAWIVATLGSSCGGGTNMTPPPPPGKSAVPSPTVLRTLYRVINGTDRMTTIGPNERSTFQLEGQLYYIPDQSVSGRVTLNRAVNAGG